MSFQDVLPAMMWTNCFLDAQGHASNDTILSQDNESTIFLEKNVKASSDKCAKRIDMNMLRAHRQLHENFGKDKTRTTLFEANNKRQDARNKYLRGHVQSGV